MPRTTTQGPTTNSDASAKASFPNGATGNAAAARVLTDDEILGISTDSQRNTAQTRGSLQPGRDTGSPAANVARVPKHVEAGKGPAPREAGYSGGTDNASLPRGATASEQAEPAGTRDEAAASQPQETAAEPEELKAIFEANPELRQAWHAEKAYREIFPKVEAARAAQSQLAEFEQLDSWFLSGQPDAHAELAAAVYRMNPAAFRSLLQAMAETLTRLGPGVKGAGKQGTRSGDVTDFAQNENGAAAAQNARPPRAAEAISEQVKAATTNDANAGPDAQQAGRFASFYQEANAAVVEGVVEAIRSQVDRLLPEGAAAGARNRVVGEIYRELDASLRSNRALAQQVRQAFRSGAMDADHQAAVAGLILGRAKQALPALAKRVINEWTTGVLAASDAKLARQRAAESRVDITGGGAPGTVPKQPLSPRDLDYSKLSDVDILNL